MIMVIIIGDNLGYGLPNEYENETYPVTFLEHLHPVDTDHLPHPMKFFMLH